MYQRFKQPGCSRAIVNSKIKLKTFCFYLLFVFMALQSSFGQNHSANSGSKDTITKQNHIVFLMLKIYKDSTTGKDTLILLDKVIKPGNFKAKLNREGLSRLPYLSIVFYKHNLPIDSIRYSYPLRDRIQQTKENPQGYKDVEKDSASFFLRFLQKEADGVKIYKISYSNKIDLLTVDL